VIKIHKNVFYCIFHQINAALVSIRALALIQSCIFRASTGIRTKMFSCRMISSKYHGRGKKIEFPQKSLIFL